MKISFILNGKPATIEAPPTLVLLHILRNHLGLTGTKAGCEVGSCGACTVIVDGEKQYSCTYPAGNLQGKTVLTIEGLSTPDGTPNDLQLAFLEHGAIQCGYCIPGIIMAAEALLAEETMPSRMKIRQGLADNLCRCTGYVQIVDAIEATGKQRARVSDVP